MKISESIDLTRRSDRVLEPKFANKFVTPSAVSASSRDTKDDILSIVDPVIYRITLNGLFVHLKPAYFFLRRYNFNSRSLSRKQSLVESLSQDLTDDEMTRWLIPSFKQLKWLTALKGDTEERAADTKMLVSCFELLLVSYYAFHAEEKRTRHIITQNLILKFLKDELFIDSNDKSKLPKLLIDYDRRNSVNAPLISFSALCVEQWRILSIILNFKIRLNHFEFSLEIIYFLLDILESLTVCFIQIGQVELEAHAGMKVPAYKKFHMMRSKQMNYRFVTAFLKATQNTTKDTSLKRIEIALDNLFDVFGKIVWTDAILNYAEEDGLIATKLLNYRVYLQSSVMTTGNLDIIQKFRKTRWPQIEAKHLVHNA